MKKTTVLLAAVLVIFTACDKIKENTTVTIPVKDKVINFEVGPSMPQRVKAPAATQAEKVLYDDVLEINIASEAEKLGYDFDRVSEFFLTNSTLELTSPTGFDMGFFKSVKLYFGDRDKLVAQADKVENNTVIFKIINSDLLAMLKEDKIRIILIGEQAPDETVKLKLKTSYKAKVKVFK